MRVYVDSLSPGSRFLCDHCDNKTAVIVLARADYESLELCVDCAEKIAAQMLGAVQALRELGTGKG